MYNGIGLQTARGSGTSGYVQKNVSYNVKKMQTKEQFLKRMELARTVNVPQARKANPQIVEHERKREILIQKMKLKAKLQEEGVPEQQINERLEKAQKILKQKLQKGEIQTKNKDTHIMSQAKQRQYTKVTNALGLKEGDRVGSSFNFEEQREQRLKQLQERRQKFTFTCDHEGCEKSYNSQERLDRHLKYKHPKKMQAIESKSQKKVKQQRHSRR